MIDRIKPQPALSLPDAQERRRLAEARAQAAAESPAERAERARRQRVDARLQQLSDDCAAVRDTIDRRIGALVSPFHARQVRPRVWTVMAKVTAHFIKCAGAEGPDYDPGNTDRYDGLAFAN
jgi:hypothetical protein